MGDLILPNPRFEKPSLFYPNRKPVGNVKIDWSHPLARGLVGCWIFQNGASQLSKIKLKSDSVITPNGLYCPSSHAEETNGATVGYNWDETDITGDFSIVSRVMPTIAFSANDYRAILSRRSSDGYQYQFRVKNNGVVSLLTTGGSVDSTEQISLDAWNEVSVTSDSNGRDFYINKASESADFKSIEHTDAETIVGSVDLTDNTSMAFGGYIDYTFLYNRKIRKGENSAIHANPYQFLIPA